MLIKGECCFQLKCKFYKETMTLSTKNSSNMSIINKFSYY